MLDAKIFEQTAPGFYRASEFKNPTKMNVLRQMDTKSAHMEHIPKPNVEADNGEIISPSNRQSKNFFKWHLGIRSKAHPADIMIEVYRALKRLGFQWKIITYYLIDVRRKVPGTNRNAYMTIQLYQLDMRTFFVDFANKVPEGEEMVNKKMDIGFTMPIKTIDENENLSENEANENLDLSESSSESESITLKNSSTSSFKKEFDKMQASFTSLPESEQSENMHETQGRIILKNGKKVRPREHVVMEFFEMCSDLIQALTCPR